MSQWVSSWINQFTHLFIWLHCILTFFLYFLSNILLITAFFHKLILETLETFFLRAFQHFYRIVSATPIVYLSVWETHCETDGDFVHLDFMTLVTPDLVLSPICCFAFMLCVFLSVFGHQQWNRHFCHLLCMFVSVCFYSVLYV